MSTMKPRTHGLHRARRLLSRVRFQAGKRKARFTRILASAIDPKPTFDTVDVSKHHQFRVLQCAPSKLRDTPDRLNMARHNSEIGSNTQLGPSPRASLTQPFGCVFKWQVTNNVGLDAVWMCMTVPIFCH